MRMSFDKESFKEAAVESHVRFNNARHQIGSTNSIALEDRDPESERNEGDIIPSDPITLRRVKITSSLGIQETRRSGIVFNNPGPPSNPEFTDTQASANGVDRVVEVYGGPRSQGRSEDAERY